MGKIACYIRVSTNKEEQKSSLENQRILLEKEYNGQEILMYSDTGTGTSFNRKGFQDLMFDAGLNYKKLKDGRLTFEADKDREPIFDEIVVVSTSRFSRNIAIIDILRTLWDFKKVNVLFKDNNKSSNNPSDMMILQMFFTMAENEVAETSKRTKRGNEVTKNQNKIRNNSIYGWDFDRVNNALNINEKEAEGVRFIFNTALNYGLKITARLTNEAGYRTKKGNLWTDSTIKTLIMNPKYKGYNVRNKFKSENLFTEHKVRYIPKSKWQVKKNDRIEPIVTEQLWDDVQKAMESRRINGNKGINFTRYDTSGKVKCGHCGATYSRNCDARIADKPVKMHYLICQNKKKYGKANCSNDNITVGMLDDFIEFQCKNYYNALRLQKKLAIEGMQRDLLLLNKRIKDNINDSDNKAKRSEINKLNNKIDSLIENFLNEDNKVIQKTVKNKIEEMKKQISELEKQVVSFDINELSNESRRLSQKIKSAKEEYETLPKQELTRKEWLDMVDIIKVYDKKHMEAIYKVD